MYIINYYLYIYICCNTYIYRLIDNITYIYTHSIASNMDFWPCPEVVYPPPMALLALLVDLMVGLFVQKDAVMTR